MKKFNRVLSALVAAVMAMSMTTGIVTAETGDPLVVKTWDFLRDVDGDHWASDNYTNMTEEYLGDGTVKLAIKTAVTGAGFYSPKAEANKYLYDIGSEAGKVRYIRFRMKNTSATTSMKIYYTTNVEGHTTEDENKTVSFTCPTSNEFMDILVDMKSTNWTGKLGYFRLIIPSGGAVYIDKIELVKMPTLTKDAREVKRITFDEETPSDHYTTYHSSKVENFAVADGKLGLDVAKGGIWGIKPMKDGKAVFKAGYEYEVQFDMAKKELGSSTAAAGIVLGTLTSAGAFSSYWSNGWVYTAKDLSFKTNSTLERPDGQVKRLAWTSTMEYFGFKEPDGGTQTDYYFDNLVIKEYPLAELSELSGVKNGTTGITPNAVLAVAMDDTLGSSTPTVTLTNGATATATVGKSGTSNTVFVTPSGMDYGKTYTMTISGLKSSGGATLSDVVINFTTKDFEYIQGITEDGDVLVGPGNSMRKIKFSLKDNDATGKMALVVAYTGDDRFIASKPVTLTNDGATVDITDFMTNNEMLHIKAFLWTTDIAPIANSFVLLK